MTLDTTQEDDENEQLISYGILDVANIDGRWAQIMGGKNPKSQIIHYLDDDSFDHIDLTSYLHTPVTNEEIRIGIVLDRGKISQGEFSKIRWGEQNTGTSLARQVRHIGTLRRKPTALPNEP